MDIRHYLSGLALVAALATASGCNGLERRAFADTSGVQGAPAAAAPSNLAAGETTDSGSGESDNYDFKELYSTLNPQKLDMLNKSKQYDVVLAEYKRVDDIRRLEFGSLTKEEKRNIAYYVNEIAWAVEKTASSDIALKDALELYDLASSIDNTYWTSCLNAASVCGQLMRSDSRYEGEMAHRASTYLQRVDDLNSSKAKGAVTWLKNKGYSHLIPKRVE